MAGRVVAVLLGEGAGFAPAGVSAEAFRVAMAEDAYEVVAGLDLVEPAVGAPSADIERAEEITWPGTPVFPVPEGGAPGVAEEALFAALAEDGAQTAVLVAGDAPDLPGLLVGKLFRALGTAEVAVCPAENGGLVALGARLPFPLWAQGVGLDTQDALEMLRGAAPRRRDLGVGPGWHRVRSSAELARLDPALEGWEATRSLLVH